MVKRFAEAIEDFGTVGKFGELLPALRSALGGRIVAAYRPLREGKGWTVELLGVDAESDAATFRTAVKRLARDAPATWGSFNPLAPELAHRNVVQRPLALG